MDFLPEHVAQLQALYRAQHGADLSVREATELLFRMVQLYRLLLAPPRTSGFEHRPDCPHMRSSGTIRKA